MNTAHIGSMVYCLCNLIMGCGPHIVIRYHVISRLRLSFDVIRRECVTLLNANKDRYSPFECDRAHCNSRT